MGLYKKFDDTKLVELMSDLSKKQAAVSEIVSSGPEMSESRHRDLIEQVRINSEILRKIVARLDYISDCVEIKPWYSRIFCF